MKILITTDAYYPMTNGVVISTSNLYRQLKYLGHDVKILTLSSSGKEYIEGDVFYLSSYSTNVYPNSRIMKPIKNKLVGELIKWSPDIIHSQTEFSTMILAKYIRRKLNIPQVHTYHTMYEDYMHYFLCGKALKRTVLPKLTGALLNTFEAVIAPTEKVKLKLESYNVSTNIKVIPTGIDMTKFNRQLPKSEKEKLLSKYGLCSNDIVMLYVGRIAEEKNIEEVLKLYRKSLKYVSNIKLLIVGGGPFLGRLKTLVKESNIKEYVKFTGMIESEEIYKYYKLGDIFVTASQSETQGITYIEALASGLPTICRWDLCVKDLIINGKTGFTYKNEDEFISALLSVIRSEKLRNNIMKNLSYKLREYSVEHFADRVLETYNEVLGRNAVQYFAHGA
ncbi:MULTISPECIES: glycosyltransferase family 4 protein [Clostridium]|uniref:glycosyltransferase family 4 protein n=1 Tax=Clostridium TaxID=1485 RepID=UPI000825E87D|nr:MULTISPECIES: glycosyltransferase family 4 protein [Clostridium]PJI09538.1 glycosyltransferase family 4 protein [Clostridium sp. CT7]